MIKQTLNDHQDVDIVVVLNDGTSADAGLSAEEVAIFEALDHTLRSDLTFQARYPHAKLVHAESNQGIPEQEVGRYYLRYQFDTGITEFWGHHADSAYVDCEGGYVGTAFKTRPNS